MNLLVIGGVAAGTKVAATHLNPQLTTNGQSGSMSFAGMNNRIIHFRLMV